LRSNFYKHQIVVLLTCTDLTMENIIEYWSRIMEFIVVVWNACLLIRDTYNWMMVCSMMRITTKIRSTKSTLLTLGRLRPWMRIVVW
jgi:hypothetical protein